MSYLPIPAVAPPNGPKLRDIHLPPTPAWWPPAPGWWILAGLILLGLLVAGWLWRRRRRVVASRQRVLREVDRLAEQHRIDGDQAAMATGLHHLLRRVARQHDSRASTQTGSAWRQTLARIPVQTPALDRLMALDEQMYRASASFDPAAAAREVKAWLRLALKHSAWKAPIKEHADA